MRTIIFYDAAFPYAGERPTQTALETLSGAGEVVNLERLGSALEAGADALVWLHGPYFPKALWPRLLAALSRGIGFVGLGGTPFRNPVRTTDAHEFHVEEDQTAYHQSLHLRQALAVNTSMVVRAEAPEDLPFLQGAEGGFWNPAADGVGLVVRFTHFDDHPDESGSSGPMDAHISPLLIGRCSQGRDRFAPVVMVENTKGTFAGGRWIFATQPVSAQLWDEPSALAKIGELANFAADGVTQVLVRPHYASYYEGERPAVTLSWQQLRPVLPSADRQVTIELAHEGKLRWSETRSLAVDEEMRCIRLEPDVHVQPGLYEIRVVWPLGAASRTYRQGFWGYDPALLQAGSEVTVGRDYFMRDDRPFPIVGMTYMASDVHRKFLFAPNPALWDRDMDHMKRSGVNFLRTGIWTAWRQVMAFDGYPSEEVLRAIDAFVLTAKRHDLPLTFNFFAFTPEMWEGTNPYLDPRSVEAQKRFVGAVVSRHAATIGVNWDLINEPSVSNPRRIFSGPQPNRDGFELRAWRDWLRRRHGSIEELQAKWNVTPAQCPGFEAVDLPAPVDFSESVQDLTPKNGRKFLDYTLFTMDVLNDWTRALTKTIRAVGAKQLVTVGQDEALASRRPSPFFYGDAVDYTTNHTWWLLDDLYWDGIFTKTPDKPNLIQETGIMYVEDASGFARRTEAELRDLLERKYALAFAAGGAGAVHWIWNINIYMFNENEANIGAVRADGTEKPEVDVSRDFGAFMQTAAPYMVDRSLEEIGVVYPYANDFSIRRYALQATTRATRTLAYAMNLPIRAIGDYQLQAWRGRAPRLIIVPSPRVLTNAAWSHLLACAEEGSTVILSGVINADEYWRTVDRSDALGFESCTGHIHRAEQVQIGANQFALTFGGGKMGWVDRANVSGQETAQTVVVSRGKGNVVWCPLPVEMSENPEACEALYELGLSLAGTTPPVRVKTPSDPSVLIRKQAYAQADLYCIVSESGYDAPMVIEDVERGIELSLTLPAERSVLVLVDRSGNVIASYRDIPVRIQA